MVEVPLKYVRIRWKHQHPDEQVDLYSELDDSRYETRKVEVFRDGRCGYASADGRSAHTMLGDVPLPELSEIARDPQFVPEEITYEEFEAVWAKRDARGVARRR